MMALPRATLLITSLMFSLGLHAATITFDTLADGGAITSGTSAFGSNLARSGHPGSIPSELLMVADASRISRVTMLGDPGGGSFRMDDASFTSIGGTTTPEPATGTLAWCVALLFGIARWAGALRGAYEHRR